MLGSFFVLSHLFIFIISEIIVLGKSFEKKILDKWMAINRYAACCVCTKILKFMTEVSINHLKKDFTTSLLRVESIFIVIIEWNLKVFLEEYLKYFFTTKKEEFVTFSI